MNILPFVTILILVISLTISSFFGGFKETSFAKIGSRGLLNAYRSARNCSEETRLLNYAKSIIPISEPENTSKKRELPKVRKKSKKSFRENISNNSKFNLTPLLTENNLFLEDVFATLLENLYVNTDLVEGYKYEVKALPKLLAKEILQAARKLPSEPPLSFEQIVLPNKHLHALWYKMLKGTPKYPSNGGWPPFSHYFICKDRNEKQVINSRKTAIPILKAFFGDEITEAILAKEKEQDRPKGAITQKELETLLSAHSFQSEHKTFINYGLAKNLRRTEVEKDPTTGISATISYGIKQ